MKRKRLTSAAALVFLAGVLFGEPPAPPVPLASAMAPPISGIVRTVQTPVSGALIVLYNVAETSLARLKTAADGTFVIASAPVGVYDLIAYKKGYQPAVVQIVHQASAQAVSAVEIQLASASGGKSNVAPASATGAPSIWELADQLPPDVLRDIDLDGQLPPASGPASRVAINRLSGGEVATVAGGGTADGALVRTTAALRGGLPNGWKYNLSGDFNSVAPTGSETGTTTTSGNSAGLALAVDPNSAEHVLVTARRNSVSFGDDPASLQTSMVSWSRGNETGTVQSVAARYFEETNLYRASAPGTTFFPIASRTWEVLGNYARPVSDTPGISVSMTYRHREAAVGPSGVGSQGAFIASSPDADLAASTTVRISTAADIQGGVVARSVAGGYGVAPRLVARYQVSEGTFLLVSGLYRVSESGIGSTAYLPRVASLDDDHLAALRTSYSAGIQRTTPEGSSFQIEASESQVGEVVRAFFEGDFLTNLDSVYLFDGNTVRQIQASAQQRLSQTLAATLSGRYGQIDGVVAPGTASAFGVSDSRGHYWSATAGVEVLPTRTGVALILHGVRQTLQTPSSAVPNDADKIGLSVSQDLSVIGLTPFGSVCKLLLAVESNRVNPPAESEEAAKNNRFMGGVALSF